MGETQGIAEKRLLPLSEQNKISGDKLSLPVLFTGERQGLGGEKSVLKACFTSHCPLLTLLTNLFLYV